MNWKKLWLTAAIAVSMTAVIPAMAQQGASNMTGSVHGHVNDPTEAPITNGIISLIPQGTKKVAYTFHTNQNGNYKGSGIKVGVYMATLREPKTPKGKVIDDVRGVRINAGKDTEVNFNLARASYIAHLSPAERKKIEEVKKKNAKILKSNKVIKNLNKDLLQARKDNRAKNFSAAEALMKKDVAVMPKAYLLWVELGTAQLGMKQYNDAISSLTKAISLNQATKKPNKQVEGIAGNVLGEAYSDVGKFAKSHAAYAAAAQADPKNAAMFYTNEAIVMSRNGQHNYTVQAADKAIAANPKNPIPYYLKGQALIQKATVNPKTQKIEAPPGCAEAYKKYLELAPHGQFANDAKSVLASLGQKVQNSSR